jgi:hypothetical protein
MRGRIASPRIGIALRLNHFANASRLQNQVSLRLTPHAKDTPRPRIIDGEIDCRLRLDGSPFCRRSPKVNDKLLALPRIPYGVYQWRPIGFSHPQAHVRGAARKASISAREADGYGGMLTIRMAIYAVSPGLHFRQAYRIVGGTATASLAAFRP